jgi:hypothetical protein
VVEFVGYLRNCHLLKTEMPTLLGFYLPICLNTDINMCLYPGVIAGQQTELKITAITDFPVVRFQFELGGGWQSRPNLAPTDTRAPRFTRNRGAVDETGGVF